MNYDIIETKSLPIYYKCKYCDYRTESIYQAEKHRCKSLKMASKLSEPKLAPTRIRYKKSRLEGILESDRTFTSSHKHKSRYKVYLNENEGTWRIQNMNTRESLYSKKTTKNTEVLRRRAKRKLEALGVKFRSGIRAARKTEE